MHSYLFPTTAATFLIITITLIHFPTSLRADDGEQYRNCSTPLTCSSGFQGLGYPFWGSNRPNYCGHPEFQLNCSVDPPQITFASLNYRVLQVNTASRNLKVVRTDYWNDLCPDQLVNTTINFTSFAYASDSTNLTLHYECPTASALLPTVAAGQSAQFNCTINNIHLINYYAIDTVATSIETCNYTIGVPVLQTANQTLQTNASNEALVEAIDGGFTLQWDANNTMCDTCQGSGGQCGSIPTTTEFACYCANVTISNQCGSTTNQKKSVSLVIGLAIGGIGIVGIFLGWCIFSIMRSKKSSNLVIWKRNMKSDEYVKAFIMNQGSLAPNRYSYSEIKKMTNSFINKLGQGGFGSVYKGKLPDGRLVAVKVITEMTGSGEEFINEVASISRTSHVNIVTLLGFCYDTSKRALIYEFMPNGSLDKFIYNQESSTTNCPLELKILFQIAVGVARGLEYLHRGCNTRILHFDIKPQNILLDEDLCPKIADFGLAKLCQKKESIVSMLGARGTAGYIAPEVFSRAFGGVSHKSDVYSYGMLVLDMVGGRKNVDVGVSQTSEAYFPNYIYKNLNLDENNVGNNGVVTEEGEEIERKMILLSLWCIQTVPADRPSMTKVVEMLEGSLESIQIPPKPFLFSPARSVHDSSTTSLS